MLIRPDRDDIRIIGFYIGKVVLGLAALMAIPLVVAIARGELNDVTALVIGIAICVSFGQLTNWRLHTTRPLEWSHGLVTVALAWMIAAVVTAVPLYLSGHFASFFDATFDALSGYTTSGLSLLQDLDHLSVAMNLLRHLMHFAGGQGIIVVVLTVLTSAGAQIATLYVGEGREDRIVPSIVQTARFIYLVAAGYAVVGTVALWLASLGAGLSPGRALFHAVTIFIAAFDTGGFSPYSTSIAYYHSALVEGVVAVLMVAGTLSFGLHYQLWRGRRRTVFANLEMRSLLVTITITTAIVAFGLARAGTFDAVSPLFRKGFFTLLSAHTGTGFAVNGSTLLVTDWGLIAPAGIVLAMALGGMASSTAGGMKAMRVGITAKSVARDIRRAIQPDAAVVATSWTSRRREVLTDEVVRPAVTILVLYLLAYVAGAAVGVFYGYPLTQALFESTSATANVGLSSGLLAASNPLPLKVVYFLQMWLGRLEFMAVFALVGYAWAVVRGRM